MALRVQGEVYQTADEALQAADELEAQLENTPEYGPQRRQLQAHIDRLRAAARQLKEKEAAAAEQPADVPVRAHRRSRPGSPRRRTSPATRKTSSPIRRFAGHAYTRSGGSATVASAGSIGWLIFGATIGVALLTVFLTPNGVKAFGGLAGAAANALKFLVAPIDPLAPGALNTVAPLTAPPAAAARPPANRRAAG